MKSKMGISKINSLIITGFFISILGVSALKAQEVLTPEEAIQLAMKHNYDVVIAKNDVAVAKNNSGVFNTGYLPSVSTSAGANYTKNDSKTTFASGDVNEVNGAESRSYNASVRVDYTLFNGFNRKYTVKRLQEALQLSELQARQVLENTIIQLYTAYHEIARLTENKSSQEKTLEVSKQRLQRTTYNFEYGQNTKLDVLNAEVIVSNDSVTVLEVNRQLANAKRNLNVLLGRDVNTTFEVSTDVNYKVDLDKEVLLTSAKEENVNVLQAQKNLALSQYDLKINRSGWMPTVGVNGGYSWNSSNSEPVNQFSPSENTQKGINGGISFSWNVFDGGTTKTRVNNAKIAIASREVSKEQIIQQLSRDINNAWETYQNRLFTLKVQERSRDTNKRNFELTNERYKLGQINSINYRQAQIDLLNAELNLSNAKYDAKNAEMQLLQLAGKLL
ncbi:TolC family protein [Aquimarina rhabdastrellae]